MKKNNTVSKKIILTFIFSIVFFANGFAKEISGEVVQIIHSSNTKENSSFNNLCITFIQTSNDQQIALVEDYYFCTIARKYTIGNNLNEEIPDNIILSTNEIDSDLQNRLQELNHQAHFLIIDY